MPRSLLMLCAAGALLAALWLALAGERPASSERGASAPAPALQPDPRAGVALAETRGERANAVGAPTARPANDSVGASAAEHDAWSGWPQGAQLTDEVELVPVLPNDGRVGWDRWLVYLALEGRAELVEGGVGALLEAVEQNRDQAWQRLGPARIASPPADLTVVVQDGWRAGAVRVPAGFAGRLPVELRFGSSAVLRAVDGAGNGIPDLTLAAGFGADSREGRTDAEGRLELGLSGLESGGFGGGGPLVVRRQLLGAEPREWRLAGEAWRAGETVLQMDDVGQYRIDVVNELGRSIGGFGTLGLLPHGARAGAGGEGLLQHVNSSLELGPRIVAANERLLVARELAGLDLRVLLGERWSEARALPPPGPVGRPAELAVERSRHGLHLEGRLAGVRGPGSITWVIERQQSADATERVTGSARTLLEGRPVEADGSFVVQTSLRGSAPVVALRGFGELAGPTGRFRVSVEFPTFGPGRLEPFGRRDLGDLRVLPVELLAEGFVEDADGRPQPGRTVVLIDLAAPDVVAQRGHGAAEHLEWLPSRTDERGHFELWGTTGARRPALQLEDQPLFSSWRPPLNLREPLPLLPGDRGLRLVLE